MAALSRLPAWESAKIQNSNPDFVAAELKPTTTQGPLTVQRQAAGHLQQTILCSTLPRVLSPLQQRVVPVRLHVLHSCHRSLFPVIVSHRKFHKMPWRLLLF